MTASHEESPGTALFEAIQRGELDAAVAQVQADPTLIHARDPALGSTPLIFAAHRGQLPVVAALLQAGADVHAREAASDTTALHWAAEMGIPAVAELLLAHGAALEHRDQWFGLTPLGWALVVRWARRATRTGRRWRACCGPPGPARTSSPRCRRGSGRSGRSRRPTRGRWRSAWASCRPA
ncbi:ankyrin repeat domain-containing protein [Nannocystis pusilla]|uniref:ankyrin repeat domain-containing protein n=1 Tax=Nannocystis pusilla TaxID=889268 RepID=UPI003B823D1B